MNTPDLQLTYQELEDIVNQDFDDRFEVLYDDIPKEGHSSSYIEDDGRQFRYFHFKDKETSKEYDFNYLWHVDWRFNFPESFLGYPPKDITFVKQSVIHPPAPETPVEAPLRTPEEQADDDLMAKYKLTTERFTMSEDAEKVVPRAVVKDAINFLNTEKFSMISLRAKMIPICIEYKVLEKAFWNHLQTKRGIWKKPKSKP